MVVPDRLTAVSALQHHGPFESVLINESVGADDVAAVLACARAEQPDMTIVTLESDGSGEPAVAAEVSADGAVDGTAPQSDQTDEIGGSTKTPALGSIEVLDAGDSAMRVLVVDDDATMRRLLEKLLLSSGYDVLTACNGVEAMQIVLRDNPQIVVSDWMMPEMTGPELCRAIRSNEQAGFVYLIIVTAHSDRERLLQAFGAGADDFLPKPFDRQELLVRMRAGMRIVNLEADLARQKRDIIKRNAQMAAMNGQLERLATTDVLTGLINRRQAMVKLEELWRLSDRYDVPFSCLVFDIDHFKQFNDTYGHAVGDLVLKATADAAMQAARSVDIIGRIGGEEFLVVCPNTDADGAAILGERIRASVEKNEVSHAGQHLKVTISLGVAQRRSETSSGDTLLKDADDALYDAKDSGRNCVRVASSALAR